MTQQINRRTVTKGIAWSVPALAVAGAAPAFATSHEVPEEPTFSWGAGCATTGNGRGCSGNQKTPQVPVALANDTDKTLQFQVLEQKSWNANGTEPPAWAQGDGMFLNTGSQRFCGTRLDFAGCDDYRSITLAPGETKSIWVVGSEMGDASAFWMKIKWRWIEVTTVDGKVVCGDPVGVPAEGFHIESPDAIISNANCDG